MKTFGSFNTICYYSLGKEDALSVLRFLGPMRELGITVIEGVEDGNVQIDRVSQADIVIIQRDFPRFLDDYEQILALAHNENKPVIFDLDDLLFELPEDHPDRYNHIFSQSLLPTLQALIEADLVTVPSMFLRNYILQFNSNVFMLQNYLNDHLWSLRSPHEVTSPDLPIIVGFMGGHSHIPDLKILIPVISNLAGHYGDRLEFHFWGIPPTSDLHSLPQTYWHSEEIFNYPKFVAYFQTQRADIFIAPLVDNYFNNCKSTIKYLEYGAMGAPGVFSRVEPYSRVITHGENGFLASTTEEWIDYLSRLIDSPQLRIAMATKVQEDIRENWLLTKNASLWMHAYQKAFNKGLIEKNQSVPLSLIKNLSRQIVLWGMDKDKQLQDKNYQIEEMHNLISEQNQVLENFKSQITQNEETIRNLNYQLTDIFNSRSWKLIKFFQCIRLFFYPSKEK